MLRGWCVLRVGVSVCVRSFATIFHVTDGGAALEAAAATTSPSGRILWLIRPRWLMALRKPEKALRRANNNTAACEETRERQFLIITPRAFWSLAIKSAAAAAHTEHQCARCSLLSTYYMAEQSILIYSALYTPQRHALHDPHKHHKRINNAYYCVRQ